MMITLFLIAFVAGILVGICLFAMARVTFPDGADDVPLATTKWPAAPVVKLPSGVHMKPPSPAPASHG
jgi:hypothetical protein